MTAAFADPCSFDVTRENDDHISFGTGGPHFCLGDSRDWPAPGSRATCAAA
ncbi:hypothetical protein AB0C14_26870 [Microbispora hainanensis]|uniref:hypothetical protein n=1 Tax=Microbispora hainanensis TaxID=568844 RepID=UPI0033DAC81C